MSKNEDRAYQIGDYWLSKQSRSPNWCRTWFDPEHRQTRRVSLRTTDFEQAKEILTDWFVSNHRKENAPADGITLAEIITHYWKDHARHLASSNTARLACMDWLNHFGEMTVAEVGAPQAQEGFRQSLKKRGLSNSAANRILTVGRAALNRAWKNGEIMAAPHIRMLEEGASQPLGRPLDFEETVALINAVKSDHLFNFVTLMLATAARPDAIRDLQSNQLDFENRLIVLNPAGRTQTKKYRPTVKMPECLVDWLKIQGDGYLVSFNGAPVRSLKTTWQATRKRSGLDKSVNPYSLRHTMARWLRKQGVPAWEVAAQLGHRQKEFTTTEIYAPFDPSYLDHSVRAIQAYFDALRVNCVGLENRISS